MLNIDDVQLFLNELLGKPINYVMRTCDLIDIGFGKDIEFEDYLGCKSIKSEYSLHLSCCFRFENFDSILFAKDDIYSVFDDDNIIKKGNTLMDLEISKYKRKYTKEFVENIEINRFGDLCITLSNTKIVVFVSSTDESEYAEHWRLIKFLPNDSIHLVKTKKGYLLED